MTSYNVYYTINKEKDGREYCTTKDAKDLKSAKNKIEKDLAKKYNKTVTASKQVKNIRITVLRYSINGYY